MGPIYTAWMNLQDVVGPVKLWPKHIRKRFWKKEVNHFDRLMVATFAWINGLNPFLLYDWLIVRRVMLLDSAEHQHLQRLFQYFEEGKKYRLYAWNVTNGRYKWLDGTVRYY